MKSMDRSEAEKPVGAGMREVAGVPVRHAGRVVVLDPGGRVLLLRYDNDPPDGRHWATPGGGLNPGETYAAAASRELAEETGWTDVALLGARYHYRGHLARRACRTNPGCVRPPLNLHARPYYTPAAEAQNDHHRGKSGCRRIEQV